MNTVKYSSISLSTNVDMRVSVDVRLGVGTDLWVRDSRDVGGVIVGYRGV